jgi:hypothetical protein
MGSIQETYTNALRGDPAIELEGRLARVEMAALRATDGKVDEKHAHNRAEWRKQRRRVVRKCNRKNS